MLYGIASNEWLIICYTIMLRVQYMLLLKNSFLLFMLQLLEKIRRSEQKNKVALEVLSYHSQASEAEIEKLQAMKIPPSIPELLEYVFVH